MSRGIHLRLAKLETWSQTDDIPVWCDTISQVPETIEAMVEEGEIGLDQRERCVFWEVAALEPGSHERRLEELN